MFLHAFEALPSRDLSVRVKVFLVLMSSFPLLKKFVLNKNQRASAIEGLMMMTSANIKRVCWCVVFYSLRKNLQAVYEN